MPNITEYLKSARSVSETAQAVQIISGNENMTPEQAMAMKNAIATAVDYLDDETALNCISLYPEWDSSAVYKADTRVRRDGVLYKCLQSHTAQSDWTPESAASLWTKVLTSETGEILEWVQPDSTNPYAKGDKVTHNGKTWESTIDSNVWEPGVYGWSEVA